AALRLSSGEDVSFLLSESSTVTTVASALHAVAGGRFLIEELNIGAHGVDAVRIIDLTRGAGQLDAVNVSVRSRGTNTSPAAFALGIIGETFEESADRESIHPDWAYRLFGGPLHGERLSDRIYFRTDASASSVSSTLRLDAPDIDALARIGLMGVEIRDGRGSGQVTVRAELQGGTDNRLTLQELLDSISRARNTGAGNPSQVAFVGPMGGASLYLPILYLPIRSTPENIFPSSDAVTVNWSDFRG